MFENGAAGAVVGATSDALEVEFYDGTVVQTAFLKHAGGWAETSTGASVGTAKYGLDVSKLWKWAKANPGVSAAGVPFLALQVALTPTALSDGTLCAGRTDWRGDVCQAYGVTQCSHMLGNGRVFGPPNDCFAASSIYNPGWTYLWGVSHTSAQTYVYPVEQYPNHISGTHFLAGRTVLNSLADYQASIGDPDGAQTFDACITNDVTTCPEDNPLSADQRDQLVQTIGAPAFEPGTADHPASNGPLPAPWLGVPLPLPPVAQGLPGSTMNPGGTVIPETITDTPSTVPGVVAATGTGTGTGSQTGSGSVTVNFPSVMDVTVQNWPEPPRYDPPPESAWALPDLNVQELDLPNASPGTKWLPSSCPAPLDFTIAGKTVQISWEYACVGMSWLGLIVNLLGAITCAFIVFRR